MNAHFDWPSRHNVHLALPLLLIVSFGLHVAGVAVFQVAHTPAARSPQRSATIYFLRPGSPEAMRFAPILAASDPALFSPGQPFGRDVWNVPRVAYVPSYETSGLSIEPPPPPAASHALPPAAQSGPVATSPLPTPAPPAPGPHTTVRFSGSLAGRSFTPPENFVFPAPTRDLRPTELLIAVAPDGRPLHLLPLPSDTRNETFERAALRYLARGRFSEAPDSQITWGTATFHWGMP